MTIKYKDVALTEEEYKEAVFNKDKIGIQIPMIETNLEQHKKEVELKLPQRHLENQLEEQRLNLVGQLETLKENYKVFEKQVRTKMKEEPVAVEETKEESKSVEEVKEETPETNETTE